MTSVDTDSGNNDMYTINSTDGYSISVPSSIALKSGLIQNISSLSKDDTEFPEIDVNHDILKIIFDYVSLSDNIRKEQLDDETLMRIKSEFIEKCHNMTPKNNYISRVLSGLYYMQFHDSLEEWCTYVSKCMNDENNDSEEFATFMADLFA